MGWSGVPTALLFLLSLELNYIYTGAVQGSQHPDFKHPFQFIQSSKYKNSEHRMTRETENNLASGRKNNKSSKSKSLKRIKKYRKNNSFDQGKKKVKRNKKQNMFLKNKKKIKFRKKDRKIKKKARKNKLNKTQRKQLRKGQKKSKGKKVKVRKIKNKRRKKSRQSKKKLKKKMKKTTYQKFKNNEKSRWKSKQVCDEKVLCQKIKDYIKISNQLRKVRRIIKACDVMDKKANKAALEFEATVTSLDSALGSARSLYYRTLSAEVASIRDELKNCSTSAKIKCQKSSVDACKNESVLTRCQNEMQSWLTEFGPSKGSCLQASQDCCSCITALPGVSKDCLAFDEKSDVAVNRKKKCTSGNEQGSFGYCKKLQVKAAEKGPGAACIKGTTTTVESTTMRSTTTVSNYTHYCNPGMGLYGPCSPSFNISCPSSFLCCLGPSDPAPIPCCYNGTKCPVNGSTSVTDELDNKEQAVLMDPGTLKRQNNAFLKFGRKRSLKNMSRYLKNLRQNTETSTQKCPNKPCPDGYNCCLPFGCWNPDWGLGPVCQKPNKGPGPICPLQKTVGNTCYERDENDIDTSIYGCTADCSYKKLQFSFPDERRFCFKPGNLPVSNYKCKYPEIVDVENGETKGDLCNRDCIKDKDNRTCAFTFTIQNLQTDHDGRRADGNFRNVTTYNGVLPGPGIVVCEGDTVVVRLLNRIEGTFEQLKGHSSGTTLHMHGIRRWNASYDDGVPGVNQCEVPSGKNFNYTMIAKIENHENAPAGTYWYHSHVGSQRTNGAEGKLIIMPRKKSTLYEKYKPYTDNATNTLFLQEWYASPNNNTPVSILINGHGKVGRTINSLSNKILWDEQIYKYNLGHRVEFEQKPNPYFIRGDDKTNYAKFYVNVGQHYRFRLIGAIAQNFPLLVSVENHTFTAVATDSIDIQPYDHIDGVWLSAGERYDIIIHTKKNIGDNPYKIRVYGNTGNNSPLCTIAWLIYPNQTLIDSYVHDSNCAGFDETDLKKILNPVRSSYIDSKNLKYVFLNDLTPISQQPNIKQNLDTYYVDFINLSFNNLSLTYNDIPFLYQSPAKTQNRCGPDCTIDYLDSDGRFDVSCNNGIIVPEKCTPGEKCQCEHVVHQPHVPSLDGTKWWFETILINPSNDDIPVSHPIHQHGGWYVVLAIKQFKKTTTINRDVIIQMDTNCTDGKPCLKRNLNNPIQKDTIQVPQNGYVIIRTPVDNVGNWIVHCHINHHVESGMAMVFQIGGLAENKSLPNQNWTLGPYEDQKNEPCKTKFSTFQNPGRIDWFFGMKPVKACIEPGNNITFVWIQGHNVNEVNEKTWKNCKIGGDPQDIKFTNYKPGHGDKTFHFSKTGLHYFACGVGSSSPNISGWGFHCMHYGLKAMVTVTNDIKGCLNTMEKEE